jgi:uncharacterized membrane protein (DUF106 family)
MKKKEETMEKWSARMYATMNEVENATDPLKREIRKQQDETNRENLENIRLQIKYQRQELFWDIFFFFIMILLIPILVLAWNIHPVLGILGIIGYVWLVSNKIRFGSYLG